ncbi:BCCT family transporter [Roseiconus nitratireducens]|uniref:BCCT family transporter n=1 Tax=Roseiconus nitratireducens TaxID=2605748 RepID=A0A5M6CVJ6_9BACT|nr:BCCT family transporter [Roseiconus nitratireducens]KAA5539073.1 BCCT family transporter [Roseiconus nitratireducens]
MSESDITTELPRFSMGKHFEMHPVVFPAGALLVLTLVLVCFWFPSDLLRENFIGIRDWIGNRFGWLYVASMSGFLVFAIWLALGRYGNVRLGADDELPEFGRGSWFAMLFSAGMGIGLLFFSVAEPIYHYQETPPGFADGLEASRLSMAVTIFHWGFHPWALYAVVGLSLAYFGFRHGMPLSFRSLLHPLLGDRVWGRTGDVIDTLAIIATLTGVATSLGIGAKQVNAGLTFLFGVPNGVNIQVGLIATITAVATASVVKGLDAGIRRLSELNIVLAGALMVLVIFGGGLISFLGASVENAGAYLQVLPFNSFRTGAFNAESRQWLTSWTVFYWAWWISWSPFVGMFIARVSRGRTIREYITGVLLVPTCVGILWLTAFGTTTLRQHTRHLEKVENGAKLAAIDDTLPRYWVATEDTQGDLERLEDGTFRRQQLPLTAVEYLDAPIVTDDGTTKIDTLPTVLFVLLEGMFSSPFLVKTGAGIATLCIVLFFVTSSDSASMVIDIIASGGNPNPPVGTRLFWALTEGIVAAALLIAGGLQALQAASIAAALPLTVVLLLACYALVRALAQEHVITNPEPQALGDP